MPEIETGSALNNAEAPRQEPELAQQISRVEAFNKKLAMEVEILGGTVNRLRPLPSDAKEEQCDPAMPHGALDSLSSQISIANTLMHKLAVLNRQLQELV